MPGMEQKNWSDSVRLWTLVLPILSESNRIGFWC